MPKYVLKIFHFAHVHNKGQICCRIYLSEIFLNFILLSDRKSDNFNKNVDFDDTFHSKKIWQKFDAK